MAYTFFPKSANEIATTLAKAKKDPEVREQMYFFDQAYSLMKIAFKDNKRESGKRYFEHLK